MGELFLQICNMSLTASWIVLTVIAVRLLFKKAPRYLICLLWGIVGLRLIFPFSIESIFSLLPSAEPLPKQVITGPRFDIDTGLQIIDKPINNYLGDRYFEGVTVPTNAGANLMDILSMIWLVGIVVMLLISFISCLRLSRKVRVSLRLRDNIYLCDDIDTPFIFGIFRPKIYLPSGMEQGQINCVVAHENAHLKRKDHLIKPLGFVLLAVYWFNPVLWAAYILLCRDIELACDEKVIHDMSDADKQTYLNTLLACSMPRYMVAACPLAFGEIGVKQRVKSILNYKKPAFWVMVAAIALCIVMSVCFLTNPVVKRLTDIEDRNETLFENIEKIYITTPDQTVLYNTESGVNAAIRQLKKVKISRKELSQSREENRPATVQVKLAPSNTMLCFNADCTEVWIDDGVKPSFSYAVKNPQVLTESADYTFADAFIEDHYWHGMTVTDTETGEMVAGNSSYVVYALHPNLTWINLYLSASNATIQLYDARSDTRWYLTYQQKDDDTYDITDLTTGDTGTAVLTTSGNVQHGTSDWILELNLGNLCYRFKRAMQIYDPELAAESSFKSYEMFTCVDPSAVGEPTIMLSLTDDAFILSNTASSDCLFGRYEWGNEQLILRTADGKTVYRFRCTGSQLDEFHPALSGVLTMEFDAENSSAVTNDLFADKAAFHFTDSLILQNLSNVCIGKGETDIDGDAVPEQCVIKTIDTNSPNTYAFAFTISVNGSIQYQDFFRYTGDYIYRFQQSDSGSWQLIGYSDQRKNTVRYDISLRNERIVLTDVASGNEQLHYVENVGNSSSISNTGGSSGSESTATTSYEQYTFDASPDPIQPYLLLSLTDNSFQFTYSALSSYFPSGSYEVSGDTLILRAENEREIYRFQIEAAGNTSGSRFGRLIFDAENSSPIPKFRYSGDSDKTESPVPDGAVFAAESDIR